MKGAWKPFLLFAAVLALALGAEWLFVPHLVPVAFAKEPQPLWPVETAFVLRAIELMSGGVAIVALALTFAAWAKHLSGRRAQ